MNELEEDPNLRWSFQGHSRPINCVLLSEDGKLVASGGNTLISDSLWIGAHEWSHYYQQMMDLFLSGH